jgi:hypothetical protein
VEYTVNHDTCGWKGLDKKPKCGLPIPEGRQYCDFHLYAREHYVTAASIHTEQKERPEETDCPHCRRIDINEYMEEIYRIAPVTQEQKLKKILHDFNEAAKAAGTSIEKLNEVFAEIDRLVDE